MLNSVELFLEKYGHCNISELLLLETNMTFDLYHGINRHDFNEYSVIMNPDSTLLKHDKRDDVVIGFIGDKIRVVIREYYKGELRNTAIDISSCLGC